MSAITADQEIAVPKKLSFIQRAKALFNQLKQLEEENGGLMTPNQARAILDLSSQRVDQIINSGDLQTVLFEGKRYITGKSVQEYIDIHLHGHGYKKPTAIQYLLKL